MNSNLTSEQNPFTTSASKILMVQSLLTTVIAWVFYVYQGQLAAQAAVFGGCIVMFNVWMTNRRMQAAVEVAKIAPGKEVRIFYLTAIQRFIFTLGFFILGMGWLNLLPIPLLVTFAIVHIGYIFHGHLIK